ncbi:hypothetical protein BDR05DRAFT_1006544 [Suillus weaverae]|nr:hypothetical protein BDR05DRAFT_1006544 [Suillus weaverae]
MCIRDRGRNWSVSRTSTPYFHPSRTIRHSFSKTKIDGGGGGGGGQVTFLFAFLRYIKEPVRSDQSALGAFRLEALILFSTSHPVLLIFLQHTFIRDRGIYSPHVDQRYRAYSHPSRARTIHCYFSAQIDDMGWACVWPVPLLSTTLSHLTEMV